MAVRRNPEHVSARNNLAMLLRRRGDGAGARRELEAVIRIDPAHESAWYNLARVRFESGDFAGSLEAIDAHLALRPESGKGWRLAGDAHRALGDADAARAAYERGD
jgi:tetratricopeptide (TPR) repeat protein